MNLIRRTAAVLIVTAGVLGASAGCQPNPSPTPSGRAKELNRSARSIDAAHARSSYVYLDEGRLAAVAASVQRADAVAIVAFDDLLARADRWLTMAPKSVTADGGGRKWVTDPPYSTDGVIDPSARRDDYLAALDLAEATVDLGVAWQLTGHDKYAAKVVELLDVWAVDPATSYNAAVNGVANVVEVFITQPSLAYATALVWPWSGWSPDQRTGMVGFFRTLGANAEAFSFNGQNNRETSRQVLVAAAASFLGDQPMMERSIAAFAASLPAQIAPGGLQPPELKRTKSLMYSVIGVHQLVQFTAIAGAAGRDVRGVGDPGRRVIDAATALVPYLLAPTTWPHPQLGGFKLTDPRTPTYVVAAELFDSPQLTRVVDRLNRPAHDLAMGPVTLTHGAG